VPGWITAVLAAALVAGCGSSHSALQLHHRARSDLESIIEADSQITANPAAALDAIKRLGVDRVRVDVRWSTLAPSPDARNRPAGFDGADPAAYPAAAWSVWDQIVQDAKARGVGLDISLIGPAPAWAAGPGEPRHGVVGVWKPDPRLFGAFVHAFAERYSGSYRPPGASAPLPRVSFWSIWNEPNYGQNLAPQAIQRSTIEVAPRLYRKLLDAGWSALGATGHGRDTILIGETAPRGQTSGDQPGNFSGMVPLRFIRALYCLDTGLQPLRGTAATERGCPADAAGSARFAATHPALFQASGFADHPYPQGALEPNVVIPGNPDYADLATIGNLEHTLDRARSAYGSPRRLPIFSTEFGYQTNPPESLLGVPAPATAAGYLNWSEYISWLNPRIRSYDQYLLADSPAANAKGGFATGLESSAGIPKATYAAFRLPLYLPFTQASGGRRLELWGCVRPAHYFAQAAGGVHPVLIQFAKGSSGAFKTVKIVPVTDPHGYFDLGVAFPGSGRVRLAWSYPGGSQIFSRTVTISG
jgi:hypothetical protein